MCRSQISDYRLNLALESLIGEMLVGCKLERFGCDYKGLPADLNTHLANCTFVKMEKFLLLNEDRFQRLEDVIETQNKVIADLKRKGLSSAPSIMDTEVIFLSNELAMEVPVPESWTSGEITCQKSISTTKGISSLANGKELLYAGSYDGSISIFNQGEKVRELQGHSLSVWSLQLGSDYLYSAGSDGIVKAWNLSSIAPSSIETESTTIDSTNSKIYSLLVHNNLLFSASSTGDVKIYDTAANHQIFGTLSGHASGINSIKLYKDFLVSCSSDRSVKLWDLNTLRCIQTIPHLTGEVLDICANDGMLFASTYDSNIHAFNLNDGKRVAVLSGHRWET
jgi:WD40 repeat protein